MSKCKRSLNRVVRVNSSNSRLSTIAIPVQAGTGLTVTTEDLMR